MALGLPDEISKEIFLYILRIDQVFVGSSMFISPIRKKGLYSKGVFFIDQLQSWIGTGDTHVF